MLEILWHFKETADCSSSGDLPGFEQAIGVKWPVGEDFTYPTVSRGKWTCTKYPWRDTSIFLSCRLFPTQHDGVHNREGNMQDNNPNFGMHYLNESIFANKTDHKPLQ